MNEEFYDIEEIRKIDNQYVPFAIVYKIKDLERLNNRIEESTTMFVNRYTVKLEYRKDDKKRGANMKHRTKVLELSPKEAFELIQTTGRRVVKKELIDKIESQGVEEEKYSGPGGA